jgi:hypothetical protein
LPTKDLRLGGQNSIPKDIQNRSENPSNSENPAKILMESPSENASEIPSENSSEHPSGNPSKIPYLPFANQSNTKGYSEQKDIQNRSENPSNSKNPAKIPMESPSENASEIPSERIPSDNGGLASVL